MDGQTDGARFGRALMAAAELYGKDLSDAVIALWWSLLSGYTVEQVERALHECLRSPDHGQYMPKPADVIRAIEGTTQDRSMQAWGKVVDAMRGVGAYRSVAFDDIAIHAAISDMGGWPHVCRQSVDEIQFLQRRFCDAYRAAQGRPAPGYLPGEFEAENKLRGFDAEPPVLVGDPARASVHAQAGAAPRTVINLSVVRRIGGRR